MLTERERKEVAMLSVLSASLLAMHKACLELLESARRNALMCLVCGKDLENYDIELCQKHFDEGMDRVMEERKHPDSRGEL